MQHGHLSRSFFNLVRCWLDVLRVWCYKKPAHKNRRYRLRWYVCGYNLTWEVDWDSVCVMHLEYILYPSKVLYMLEKIFIFEIIFLYLCSSWKSHWRYIVVICDRFFSVWGGSILTAAFSWQVWVCPHLLGINNHSTYRWCSATVNSKTFPRLWQ